MDMLGRQELKRVLKNKKGRWLAYLKDMCTQAKQRYYETNPNDPKDVLKAMLFIYAGAYNRDRAVFDTSLFDWAKAAARCIAVYCDPVRHREELQASIQAYKNKALKPRVYHFTTVHDALGDVWWR